MLGNLFWDIIEWIRGLINLGHWVYVLNQNGDIAIFLHFKVFFKDNYNMLLTVQFESFLS